MPDVLKTVGRYEILREIGRGGMAMVYLARQTDLDRFVALKELAAFHASDAAFAQRFLRESRVAGSLSHPNIVTVHDYFEHDGTPYIAMEYVERGSLRPYVGHMTLAQIGGVLEGLLAGLAHAEQHGIVHRDLKPENLMVTVDGRVKIADFGIAKATNQMQTGAVPHRDGHDGRHADLHGAGAGDGAGHRAVDRPLLGRLHGVRDVHGPRAVPRLGRADGDPAAPRQRADRAREVDRPLDRPGRLGLGRGAARQGPEGADAVRGRGLGRARGDRHRAAGPALAPRRAALARAEQVDTPEAAHAGAVRGHGDGGAARRRSSRASPGAQPGTDPGSGTAPPPGPATPPPVDAPAGPLVPGPIDVPTGPADAAAAHAGGRRRDRLRDLRRARDPAAGRGRAAAGARRAAAAPAPAAPSRPPSRRRPRGRGGRAGRRRAGSTPRDPAMLDADRGDAAAGPGGAAAPRRRTSRRRPRPRRRSTPTSRRRRRGRRPTTPRRPAARQSRPPRRPSRRRTDRRRSSGRAGAGAGRAGRAACSPRRSLRRPPPASRARAACPGALGATMMPRRSSAGRSSRPSRGQEAEAAEGAQGAARAEGAGRAAQPGLPDRGRRRPAGR